MRLIVGLGNPGPDYAETRHNVGFWVVEAVAAEAGLKFRRHAQVSTTKGRFAGQSVVLAKPQAYMNRSGPPVASLLADLVIDLNDLIVVHDDLDLVVGRLRIKAHGGAGGHNGVLSLIEALGSDRFARVKIGVGRPPTGEDPADYVLTPAPSAEQTFLDDAVTRAVEAVACWIADGTTVAMNRFNQPLRA